MGENEKDGCGMWRWVAQSGGIRNLEKGGKKVRSENTVVLHLKLENLDPSGVDRLLLQQLLLVLRRRQRASG